MMLQPPEQSNTLMEKVSSVFVLKLANLHLKLPTYFKKSLVDTCDLLYPTFNLFMFMVFILTGEDDSLALKKKVTIEDVFGPDLHIHDPDAKWLSGEGTVWLLASASHVKTHPDTLRQTYCSP